MEQILKVLILEDNEDDAYLASHELKKAGFSFESTRVDTLEDFRNEVAKNPDLILADFALPLFNALDALAVMSELELNLPFVLISGKISEETAVRCIKAGASDYVNKNRLDTLPSAVRQALAEYAFRQEKLQMERALIERETKYRKLFEDSSEGILIIDLDWRILDCNRAFEELLGYTYTELIGEPITAFYRDTEKLDYIYLLLREQEVVENFEIEFSQKSGVTVYGLATISYLNDDTGERAGMLAMVRDVTDRVKGQRELEKILAINTAMRTASDNNSLFPIVMDLLLDISSAQSAALEVVSQISGKMMLEMAAGGWEKLRAEDIQIDEATLDHLMTVNEPKLWEQNQAREYFPLEALAGLECVACIPLCSSDIDIGLIWLGGDKECFRENLHLVQVLAQITANTIHRFNLNENNLRALLESQAVARISRTLNEHLDLEKVFSLIVEEAVKLVPDAHRAVIHLFDEENQRLHAVGYSEKNGEEVSLRNLLHIRVTPRNEFDFGYLSEEDVRAATMISGKGIAGKVIQQRQTINVFDAREDPRYLKMDNEITDLSLVVSPILSSGKPLGTLSVLSRKVGVFDISVERLLENLCVQAATALENARLLEAERQAREIAEAQTEISTLLNRSLELDEVLDTILAYAVRVFNATAANLVLFEGKDIQVFKHSGYGFLGEAAQAHQDLVEGLFKGFLRNERRLLEEGFVVPDTWNDPNWRIKEQAEWVRSFVSVPLLVGREVIGVFNAESDKVNTFGEREMQLFETFANNAASAVNNARLYEDLERSLITEKNTRTRLIRADKLAGMGRMVASVAHELNNPLQTIKNCLFLIEQSTIDPEAAEILDLGMSEVERLTGIVNRLRDVYRPSHNREYKPVMIGTLLDETEVLLETHLRRNKVNLTTDVDKLGEKYITGFADRLKQVFINLSLNAIEAMQPDGGDLTIRLMENKSEKQIGIAFVDSGLGINPVDMTLIFDPFYTTKDTGMGLGLSICYDIVRDHSGTINVENNPDTGATFTVWLPLFDGQP